MMARPYAQPGMAHAGQILHPGPPLLRDRYPVGVEMTPYGSPDWVPYARTLVELPPPPRELTWDEARVLGVQTANELGRLSGDPLWTVAGAGTPVGWAWARIALTRNIALIPIDLHASFRHVGGVSTSGNDWRRHGLPGADGAAPQVRPRGPLTEQALADAERQLGYPLPTPYRQFLAQTNGGRPTFPAVQPGLGFIADQPLFGLGGGDPMTDLVGMSRALAERLTPDYLPIAYVQGGLWALKATGVDAGSVWYLDDDDPRDKQGLTPDVISLQLTIRIGDDFNDAWRQLRAVPQRLRDLASSHATEGWARLQSHPLLGANLPAGQHTP
jgi:hypothetical protein